LINYAPGLLQSDRIDSALTQLHSLGQCPKMINKRYAGVLAAE
jgi:hypothetical protein